MKSKFWFNLFVVWLLLAFSFGMQPSTRDIAKAATIVRVKPGGSTSAGCGSTWGTACELQTALTAASSGTEIWVAVGTYKPGTNREDTFQLKSGVALYSGFAGTETAREQRDWENNTTVLSGDIGVPDDSSDNCIHIITASGVDATSELNGFNITRGNADGGDYFGDYYGGGVYSEGGSPSLVNLTLEGNIAAEYGGGMYSEGGYPSLVNVTFDVNKARAGGGMHNYFSNPTLTNVTFSGNKATSGGGGMVSFESNTSLTNVTFKGNIAMNNGGGLVIAGDVDRFTNSFLTNVDFIGNLALNKGGGMINFEYSPTLTNVTFSGNKATFGGGLYNDGVPSPIIINTVLWGNTAEISGPQIYNNSGASPSILYSNVEGGCAAITGNNCSGGGNIDANPLFNRNPDPGTDGIWGTEDDDYGDLRLMYGSSAIDAGDNTAPGLVGIATDLGGKPRFYDVSGISDTGVGPPPVVDIGGYEKQANDAPSAGNDFYNTEQDVPLHINAPGVLANDSDPDGYPISTVLESGPGNGSLEFYPDGSFDYLPEANFTGVETFTYRVWDDLLVSNTATVTIKVSGVNAPVAFNDIYITPDNTLLSVNTPGVLMNDSDPDGDSLSAVLENGPSRGFLILNPDGSFDYMPDVPSSMQTFTFTYHATDGSKNSNTATVTITVNSENKAPIAVNDTYTTRVNETLSIDTQGVLKNDSDPDGNPLTAVLMSGPGKGFLTLNPDGSFEYQPEKDHNGVVTFTYFASDSLLDSNIATVTITVSDPGREIYLPMIICFFYFNEPVQGGVQTYTRMFGSNEDSFTGKIKMILLFK